MNTTMQVQGGMFDSTAVVETVDGFPRGDKAVDSAFFAEMMRCFYTDGVVKPTTGAWNVSPGEGLSVLVSPGCAWIFGRMAWLNEEVLLPIAAGHSYGICLRLHRNAGYFTLESVEDPMDSLPIRNKDTWDLLLAEIEVPGDCGVVTREMITDRRLDDAVCGPVVCAAESLDSVAFALNSGAVGGLTAAELIPRSGGVMTGVLQAANDTTGNAAVRNIRYGYTLPDALAEGEIFLLLTEE